MASNSDQCIQCHDAPPLRENDERIDVDLGNLRHCSHQAAKPTYSIRCRVCIELRCASEPAKKRGTAQLIQLLLHGLGRQVRRKNADIMNRLRKDAAEPDEQDGAPVLVITGTNDQFDAHIPHTLNQNPIGHQAGPIRLNIAMERQPCFRDGFFRVDSQYNATGFRLVWKIGRLHFQRHGIAYLLCDADSFVDASREATSRDRNSNLV